jgi:hypothetical protein
VVWATTPLSAVAAVVGGVVRAGRVASVDSPEHRIELSNGSSIDYALVLGADARARAGLSGQR